MTEPVEFWANWFVWRDAMIVALIAAAALSYLGVWVVLKEVVYVPLAISQASSVGVVIALLVNGVAHDRLGRELGLDPTWTSLLFALGISLYFARARANSERNTVVTYLVASALTLILGGFLRQDLHDVDSLLFGHAVLVETIQILYVSLAAAVVLVVHLLLYRRFLFASFDPDTAGAAGLATYRIEVALYMSFAVMISVGTRAIGALPAFGFAVLPALTGLRLGRTMPRAFVISAAIGLLSAGLGYYLSFVWELPAGACMVAFAGAVYLTSLAAPHRIGRA